MLLVDFTRGTKAMMLHWCWPLSGTVCRSCGISRADNAMPGAWW